VAWKKSPPELIAAFERVVLGGRGVERRFMFGYPAAFVNGNMFAGLFEDSVALRLGEVGAAEAKRVGATDFAPMAGRRMTGWVAMGGRRATDEAALRRWVVRACRHAEALPAKAKRKRAGGSPRARPARPVIM
jgi:TfoX/Sxy family transcriptional regulator of competence genes